MGSGYACSERELFGAMAIRENLVEVPYTRLAGNVLRRMAEEFVTRDGTGYGPSQSGRGDVRRDVNSMRRGIE